MGGREGGQRTKTCAGKEWGTSKEEIGSFLFVYGLDTYNSGGTSPLPLDLDETKSITLHYFGGNCRDLPKHRLMQLSLS